MLSACGRTVQGAPARRGAQLKSASRARLPVLYVAQPKRSAGAEAAQETSSSVISSLLPGAAAALPILLHADAALAKGGVYGILEGRTAALVHPAVMISLFFATGYAGYLGWQWRRTRTIGEEIKELKKQLPPAAEDGTRPASPVAAQVEQMEKERKELINGNFKDKHFVLSSVILATGVGIAIEGCANTFMRTERLFPGPHLYAGAGIVALWALAAALVPAMQKGNDTARSAHIGLNAINFALFAWQVPTGLEIVGKVFQFTSWP